MNATYLQGDLFASPRPAYAPAAAPRTSAMTSALPPAPIAPEGPALGLLIITVTAAVCFLISLVLRLQ